MGQLRSLSILLVIATSMFAQQPGTSANKSKSGGMEEALQKRFREYTEALTKKDVATLDRIWASDYIFINPRGELVTKAQRLENVKNGATEFKAINPQNEKLQVHGDVAVDIGSVQLQGTKYSGQESSRDYRYMNIWKKQGGQWQMIANQITPIKK